MSEKLVLDCALVVTALGQSNVVAMKEDWTRPSEPIASYLAGFGRYGIPFSVVYGPDALHGFPLPEILTSASVMAALKAAGGRAVATQR